MEIKKENIIRAYWKCNSGMKEMLRTMFPDIEFETAQAAKKRPVTNRIKTFEDACRELGEGHPLVKQYEAIADNDDMADSSDTGKDIIAYLKLRIIVAALNEGWKPRYTPEEYRWFPYFMLYTQYEMDEMNEETRARVVCRSGGGAGAYGGVSCASSNHDAAGVYAGIGSRLAFKTEELAEYSGKQFLDIWADYLFG